MIEAGTLTVMAAHIALPAYEEYFDQKPCERILPATLSENLVKEIIERSYSQQKSPSRNRSYYQWRGYDYTE